MIADEQHLRQLLEAGPCQMPPTDSNSWKDEAWMDAWLRNHPEQILASLAVIVRLAPPPQPAPSPKARTVTPTAAPVDAAAVRRRQIHAYAHKHGLSDRAAEQHLNRKAQP